MQYEIYTVQWAYKNQSDECETCWRDIEELTISRYRTLDRLLYHLLFYTVDMYFDDEDRKKIKFRLIVRDIEETVL